MEINELLGLETFPKSYEACFLESCSVKENCLHHLYFQTTTIYQHMGWRYLPICTLTREPCEWLLQVIS